MEYSPAEETLYCHNIVEDVAHRSRTVFRVLYVAVGERRERMIPTLSRMLVRIAHTEARRGGLSSARSAALILSNVGSASESRHEGDVATRPLCANSGHSALR
jgi:hypothetical protein